MLAVPVTFCDSMSFQFDREISEAGASSATANPAPPRKPRALSKRKKVFFALLTCCVFFCVIELALALCGVKPLYLSRDPYVGFQPGNPLFVRDGQVFKTNQAKLAFFNHQEFPAVKAPNAYRIFCLGGSTTYGHPYRDSTSYCGWLREFLRESEPQRDWQVVNCGGVSYASYRERLLMQELVRYQPDLFIVLSGHNEFLEERSYGALRQRTPVREALDFVIARTRIGALAHSLVGARPARSRDRQLLSAEVDTILEHSIGPTDYHRDAEQQSGIIQHFRESLTRMCEIARGAGARVIFISPASNLRGFTPFKSEHGAAGRGILDEWDQTVRSAREARRRGDINEALSLSLAATQLDPQYAEGLWDAADALFAAGRFEEARTYFLAAVDEDICPLRANRVIREIVKSVSIESGSAFIDFPEMLEQDLERTRGHRIPGDESFLDHVHPTIEIHRELAWELFDRLVDRRLLKPPADRKEVTRQVVARVMSQIDSRAHALALVQVIQLLSWAGKNKEALRLTERAEEVHPGLSDVVMYRGRLLEILDREEEAYECYQEAVRRNPEDYVALFHLGCCQERREQTAAAGESFDKAALLTPLAMPVSFRAKLVRALGMNSVKLGRWHDAVLQLEESLRLAPGDPETENVLAAARLRAFSGRR